MALKLKICDLTRMACPEVGSRGSTNAYIYIHGKAGKEMNSQPVGEPKWNNQNEYASASDPCLLKDLAQVKDAILTISSFETIIAEAITNYNALLDTVDPTLLDALQQIGKAFRLGTMLINNILTFIRCELDVNSLNENMRRLKGEVDTVATDLKSSAKGFSLLIMIANESLITSYLSDPDSAAEEFLIRESRKLKAFHLPLAQERTIARFSSHGILAWGTLYNNISGVIASTILDGEGKKKRMGLAETTTWLESPDENVRYRAYLAINKGWRAHEESCASCLNAIFGWHLEEYRQRSPKGNLHYLDPAFHQNRISRPIIDALITSVKKHVHIGRKSLSIQAKALGKQCLGPEDLFCPPPTKDIFPKIPFEKAIRIIRDSFGTVSQDMADFVDVMVKNAWIEGTKSINKKPGAYCTIFQKSRTPRVFMTYNGGIKDFMTLAHELGHAYHNWVIRDLPIALCHYPSTLAETASTFAEALVLDTILEKYPEFQLPLLWHGARQAEVFLLNILARFDMENQMFEHRNRGTLTPTLLKNITREAWNTWYGESLREPNEMFWASKLHFYLTSSTFYNIPYTFGFLFSLGIYNRRSAQSDFNDYYVNLLRDMGRYSCGDLARKHLDTDLEKTHFWEEGLSALSNLVRKLEVYFS